MKQKLHVLFLCGWYPSRVSPLNGDFVQRHAEAVNSLHKVSVVHIISDENCNQNIEIISETINNVETHIAYIKKTTNPLIKQFRFYKAFKKTLKKIEDFDIVHLNIIFPFGILALYLKWLKNKPFIISEHWTGYHYPQVKNISKIQLFFSRKIVREAHFICPVSMELQNSMEAIQFNGNYKAIHNTVNTDIFFPRNLEKNKVFTILHISNMVDAHKNVSGIIKAVAKLNFEYQLLLIGKNSTQYKTVSDNLGITENIKFIEHLPHQKIPLFLNQADVYISFSNYETWGIVMVESLACGTPVISTKTGILHELNLNEFASIINLRDENELQNSILAYKKQKSISSNEMYNFVKTNFAPIEIAKQLSILYQKSLL